jgi:hypothetical protein
MPLYFSFLLSGRSYWHDRFTSTLDIPRRFQILSTWPGNRAILERSRSRSKHPFSAKSCLEESACTCLLLLCSSCFASLYGIRVFRGRQTRGIGYLPNPHILLLLCCCCVLARTDFVPCFHSCPRSLRSVFSLMCLFQRRQSQIRKCRLERLGLTTTERFWRNGIWQGLSGIMCEVRGSGVGLPSFTPIWCSPFLPCVSPTYVGMGYGLDLGSGYLKSAVSRRRIIVDMDFF